MDEQEKMRMARTQEWYDTIWKTVGKCVFCDLKDKYILYEENGVVLTVNIYPYIDGQMMAIPRRHLASPKELTSEEWETMRKMNYLAKKLIKKVHGHKGMWSLIREGGDNAQMSVSDHLHMQLIPFDAKDLCTWNYRELKNTPIRNAKLYKEQAEEMKKIIEKFERKYSGNDE
jgi:diadenosine tetraphosphate (Ap4A) HIT family hydrolase